MKSYTTLASKLQNWYGTGFEKGPVVSRLLIVMMPDSAQVTLANYSKKTYYEFCIFYSYLCMGRMLWSSKENTR